MISDQFEHSKIFSLRKERKGTKTQKSLTLKVGGILSNYSSKVVQPAGSLANLCGRLICHWPLAQLRFLFTLTKENYNKNLPQSFVLMINN